MKNKQKRKESLTAIHSSSQKYRAAFVYFRRIRTDLIPDAHVNTDSSFKSHVPRTAAQLWLLKTHI